MDGLVGLGDAIGVDELLDRFDRQQQVDESGQVVADLLAAGRQEQVDKLSIIHGTPATVLPKIRHVLEELQPGAIIFWDGDGSMNHDDAMRSLRLMGEEILPAVREIGAELALDGPFEVDPASNERLVSSA